MPKRNEKFHPLSLDVMRIRLQRKDVRLNEIADFSTDVKGIEEKLLGFGDADLFLDANMLRVAIGNQFRRGRYRNVSILEYIEACLVLGDEGTALVDPAFEIANAYLEMLKNASSEGRIHTTRQLTKEHLKFSRAFSAKVSEYDQDPLKPRGENPPGNYEIETLRRVVQHFDLIEEWLSELREQGHLSRYVLSRTPEEVHDCLTRTTYGGTSLADQRLIAAAACHALEKRKLTVVVSLDRDLNRTLQNFTTLLHHERSSLGAYEQRAENLPLVGVAIQPYDASVELFGRRAPEFYERLS